MGTTYNGFRKTIIKRATLEDTLQNMQRIAIRDQNQVADLASSLTGDTVEETCENIWMWLRTNTRYKLDRPGYEELRTPARSIVDGEKGLHNPNFGIDCDDYTILVSAMLLSLGIRHEYRVAAYEQKDLILRGENRVFGMKLILLLLMTSEMNTSSMQYPKYLLSTTKRNQLKT
jgi:hypothetical protein